MREGRDATLISTGGILQNVVRAAERLAKEGVQARVLSMHTLKPLDSEAILTAARETGALFTIEEHSVVGGLGSAVAEVLAEAEGVKVPFKRLGVPTGFSPHIGSQEYMQECHGLTDAGIAKSVVSVLRTVTSG
jgi:transketolase